MLCLPCAACHRVALAHIERLLQKADALGDMIGIVARIRRLELLDHFRNTLGRAVIGVIVDNNHLKFVHGIILIDTAVNCALNPVLFIKTGDNDRHARRKIGINAYRAIERREEIARQEKCRRYDAVEVEPSVELKVDHGLRTHEHDDECNDSKKERRDPQHVVAPLRGGIFRKTLFELHPVEYTRLRLKATRHRCGKFFHLHLIALGHRTGRDLERQLDIAFERRHGTPRNGIHPYEDARRRDVDRTPREAAAARQTHLDRIVNEIPLSVLGILFIAYIVLGVHFIRGSTATVIAAMSCRIRHMGEKPTILLLLIQDILHAV